MEKIMFGSNHTDESISNKEFISKLALNMNTDEERASKCLEEVIDTLYEAFKNGKGVKLKGFGNFYLSKRKDSTIFKFNPSSKLKKLLGWSSTYKGDF
jgi:DNA-binding protein HU-beta